MITLETALAAVVTFVLGMICGVWVVGWVVRSAIRVPMVRKYYREIIDKAERHDLESHEAV
jgi:beta-lactamase regulating signal transducer with metallopeptidase domain